MKILTVLGARPQFIKASAFSRLASDHSLVNEIIIHTGQHYDSNMSGKFFKDLGIPDPKYNLGISRLSHGAMTGRMLEGIETILIQEKPEVVLVYGDTNSTVAGALAASKLHIPVAHVEAGLRSFNCLMPEEQNRIVTDVLSQSLYCPTETAVNNLNAQGIVSGVHLTGDVMYDVARYYGEIARETIDLNSWEVESGHYVLATIHRAENTDDKETLREILHGLSNLAEEIPVILPLHPRTKSKVEEFGLIKYLGKIKTIDPLSYLDMIRLEKDAKVIVTDSGGVQKEAYFHGVPCITMREQTEWVETVSSGWNVLVGACCKKIVTAYNNINELNTERSNLYGDGDAASKILMHLIQDYSK